MKEVTYDPATGIFWRDGKRADCGSGKKHGHRRVQHQGRRVLAHRLAWFLTHGSWPTLDIDHINGDPADNRIVNLREVTRQVNIQNQRKAQRNARANLLGVHWNAGNKKWRACITTGGKRTHLGLFETAEAAHEAYVQAKRKQHAGCTL
jgi:hypothetical protein